MKIVNNGDSSGVFHLAHQLCLLGKSSTHIILPALMAYSQFVGFINVVSGALIYNKYKDRESFVGEYSIKITHNDPPSHPLHPFHLLDPALILVPLLMTILGSCTIGLALLGCFGMALRSKLRSIIFFTLNMLIMFSEICLGSYWWHDSKNFMQFPQLFNWFLQSDLSTGEEWATLQIKVKIKI